MTTNELFDWMARRRVPPRGCAICGLAQLTYYRDGQERAIGMCCLRRGLYEAEVDTAAIRRRLHALTHDCPAEGCPACQEAGA